MTCRISLTFSKCSIKHMFPPSHCFWNEFFYDSVWEFGATCQILIDFFHLAFESRKQDKAKQKLFDRLQTNSPITLSRSRECLLPWHFPIAKSWDWINWHSYCLKPSTQSPGPDTADPLFKWRYHDKSQQFAFSFVISRSHHRRRERKTLLTMSQDSVNYFVFNVVS